MIAALARYADGSGIELFVTSNDGSLTLAGAQLPPRVACCMATLRFEPIATQLGKRLSAAV